MWNTTFYINTQSLKEKTWQMGSAFLMKKAENHCGDAFYLQSPFFFFFFSLVPTWIDWFPITILYHRLCVVIVIAACLSLMSLFCNANYTTKVDVKAMMYLLLSLWLFIRLRTTALVFCVHFPEKNAGTIFSTRYYDLMKNPETCGKLWRVDPSRY